MTNTPISASNEQKPASPAPQQTQGTPQQGNQQQNQGGGDKPSTDKPASQPQQK
jgi:hypothetical protein